MTICYCGKQNSAGICEHIHVRAERMQAEFTGLARFGGGPASLDQLIDVLDVMREMMLGLKQSGWQCPSCYWPTYERPSPEKE